MLNIYVLVGSLNLKSETRKIHSLLTSNIICHFCLLNRELIHETGGIRPFMRFRKTTHYIIYCVKIKNDKTCIFTNKL